MAESLGMTTSGEAIATSVNDPNSKDAVFVPFSHPENKKPLHFVDKRKKKKMSTKILESFKLEGMKAVSEALMASLSENDNNPIEQISNLKTLLECKKNKEEFKKLMAEKLAAKNGKKQEEKKPEVETTPTKKMTLKDKIAQRKSKKMTENNEKTDQCCICGTKDCKCQEIGDQLVCDGCAKMLAKKQRINEGIERLRRSAKKTALVESAKRRVLSESSEFSRELEIVKAAKKHHEKLSEAFVDKSGGIEVAIVGFDFSGELVKTANIDDAEFTKQIYDVIDDYDSVQLSHDDENDIYVLGIDLNKHPEFSPNEASKIVDKCSAAVFAKMEELGIDTKTIDTNCSLITIVY